jgi:hypothetical protein
MTGLRLVQRGVFALTLAVLLALQLGPVATAAFDSVMPGAKTVGTGWVVPMFECEGDTCG